jgi:hypothetical protein
MKGGNIHAGKVSGINSFSFVTTYSCTNNNIVSTSILTKQHVVSLSGSLFYVSLTKVRVSKKHRQKKAKNASDASASLVRHSAGPLLSVLCGRECDCGSADVPWCTGNA